MPVLSIPQITSREFHVGFQLSQMSLLCGRCPQSYCTVYQKVCFVVTLQTFSPMVWQDISNFKDHTMKREHKCCVKYLWLQISKCSLISLWDLGPSPKRVSARGKGLWLVLASWKCHKGLPPPAQCHIPHLEEATWSRCIVNGPIPPPVLYSRRVDEEGGIGQGERQIGVASTAGSCLLCQAARPNMKALKSAPAK